MNRPPDSLVVFPGPSPSALRGRFLSIGMQSIALHTNGFHRNGIDTIGMDAYRLTAHGVAAAGSGVARAIWPLLVRDRWSHVDGIGFPTPGRAVKWASNDRLRTPVRCAIITVIAHLWPSEIAPPRRQAHDHLRQPPADRPPMSRPAGENAMPPVRRHRIGDQLPAVIHPGPDPTAIALCRDLVAETDAEAVVLFGSRATGGWDEQSDLDMIVVCLAPAQGDRRETLERALLEIRERLYPGYGEYDSPHHGVTDGLMVETPQHYHACRRTPNHVIARAARAGRIFTKDPSAASGFLHDGDVSNEWNLVTLERLQRASEEARDLDHLRGYWLDQPRRRPAQNALPGRNAHGLLWNSGAALLSILGVIYPRDSVAEMTTAITRHDAGWSHAFRSDLERIDQYSGCGCEVVVTDPIDDVPAMWRDLESDRIALWERIRALSGYDLAQAQSSSDSQT